MHKLMAVSLTYSFCYILAAPVISGFLGLLNDEKTKIKISEQKGVEESP